MLKRVLFVIVSLQFCLAQETSPAIRPIVASTSRSIQAPPFGYFGAGQCDSDGNMYFHDDTSEFRAKQIFKLSRDGSTGKIFRVTGKFADPDAAGFDSFWVTAEGEVFILAANTVEKYVFIFTRDGTMKDPLVLQVPKDVQLTDFGVFDSGFIFVWGYRSEESSKELQGKPYVAILKDSGEVSRELSIALPKIDLGNLGVPSDGAVASSVGNLYFLGSNQITVISQTGEVVRKLKYHKPDPKAFATKIYLSGGMAVIALDEIANDNQVSRSFMAFDQYTGELIGHYKPSPELNGSDVCFTRDDGMTFLQMDGKSQKLITAPLR